MTGAAVCGDGAQGFEIERFMESADRTSAALEVSTHHVLKIGSRDLDFRRG